MAYKPSPRPTFSEPTHLPYASVTRHLWGDPEAGEVADWIYVSSDKIHHLVFSLAPGGEFRHSNEFRTIFAADQVYYVLRGVMVIANPETGEVRHVKAGEAVFFRRDTWHHAFNYGSEPLRVLEYFSPPPSQGTSGAYARTKPLLTQTKYTQDQALGRWPMERATIERDAMLHMVRETDLLWQLVDGKPEVLVGTLNMLCPEKDGQRWFELNPQDGFYIPAGSPHQYYNYTDKPVTLIFGVAPAYT